MSPNSWPDNKRFALTIIDDADDGTLANTAAVYRLLHEVGLRTTKTVWVYPPRDRFGGQCLQDPDYLDWVRALARDGFEIALHNVGSGAFTRDEILQGLETFAQLVGHYPRIQVNHSANPDNIYWGAKRHVNPVRALLERFPRRTFMGDDPASGHFWGDACKRHITYMRNHVFNGINTLAYDPRMPYRAPEKEAFSNYWFSSSDAHTVSDFNRLVTDSQLDRLEAERGACIIYTHFACGFQRADGALDPDFEASIRRLAARPGWFVPAGRLLDHLAAGERERNATPHYLQRLDWLWFRDRLQKKLLTQR